MTSNSTPARALLIWDAPNMDMGLSTIVGGRPNSYQRPRFDAAGLWPVSYTHLTLPTKA